MGEKTEGGTLNYDFIRPQRNVIGLQLYRSQPVGRHSVGKTPRLIANRLSCILFVASLTEKEGENMEATETL